MVRQRKERRGEVASRGRPSVTYILLKVSESLTNLSASGEVPSSLTKSRSLSKSQKTSISLTKSQVPESLKSLKSLKKSEVP